MSENNESPKPYRVIQAFADDLESKLNELAAEGYQAKDILPDGTGSLLVVAFHAAMLGQLAASMMAASLGLPAAGGPHPPGSR